MEAYGSFPRGRGRFGRHYSDSKKVNEMPTTPDANGDPELIALHAEFKIQRERLGAWGREWGDDRTGEAEWDETFERAEWKDAIHDVLENVKDVLDKSEQLSHGMVWPKGPGEKKGPIYAQGVEKIWGTEERTKYAELAEELRQSIDLLYDISKNRKEIKESSYPGFAGKGKADHSLPPPVSRNFLSGPFTASEETLINPSRSSTQKTWTANSLELPPRLDLSSLDLPEEEPPPYDIAGATPSTRMNAHLRQPSPPSQSDSDTGNILIPVLIEYAPFDSSYRTTGVSVPTNRLDSLMTFYARCGSLADFPQYGVLSCLGYFEDPREARFGLVYELPQKASAIERSAGASIDLRPVSLQKVLQQASKSLNSNRQIPPGPPLEDRFRLAFNITQAFAKLHGEERLIHKDVNSSNVIFFLKPTTAANNGDQMKHEYDLRSPYLVSFDLFSEYSIEDPPTTPGKNIYRHPLDPKIFNGPCEFCNSRSCKCSKYRFDIYGLGLLLLEIGLWGPLSDLFKQKYSLDDFRKRLESIWVRKLASRCGSIYMNIVKDCFQQASQNLSDDEMRVNYEKWLRKLQKICILDEDDELPITTSTPTRVPSISGVTQSNSPESSFHNAETSSRNNNPFINTHAAPTSTSFFSNPFSRFTSTKKTELPFAIKEEKTDDAPGTESRQSVFDPSTVEHDGGSFYSTSRKHLQAAKVIQKAWRAHQRRDNFQTYILKVILIQRTWRNRQIRCSGASQQMSRELPSQDIRIEAEIVTEYSHFQVTRPHAVSRPKLRLHTVKLTPELLDEWHDLMLPKLERICERCLKDSPETVSIDLIGVGETALAAKPTIFITCTSTGRVRSAINRKFQYDHDHFDLRVRKGRVRRSKVSQPKRRAPPHRSMMNSAVLPSDTVPLNPFHQERPICGASIGAYVGNKHLPPVSYGGVVHVDGEPFGMTVHHLLDSPSDEDSEFDEEEAYANAERSSARRTEAFNPFLAGMAGHPTLQTVPTDSMFPLEISDDDEPLSSDEEQNEGYSDDDEEYFSSDFESDNESVGTAATGRTLGDLSGILPGQGTDMLVTQPALDDVEEGFFPSEEDKDEDHLASHKLGYVHASSGIRRWNRVGDDGRAIKHEIDWALMKLDASRLQPYNLVQGGRKHLSNPHMHDFRTPQLVEKLVEPVCRGAAYTEDDDEFPVRIAKTEELGNLRVHCFGRTSGLQGGVVGPAMSSVKIYRRQTMSRSWHVVGNFGVGGDSGAWVIDNEQGRVCGHVLAWCERNAIAYICPMEVMLEDIKNTLGAKRICLPSSEDEHIELATTYRNSTGRSDKGRLIDEKRDIELPDIARLDFGDKERLGLRGAAAEEIMRRSAASMVVNKVAKTNGTAKPRMDMELKGIVGLL